jgi:hypothetical protein
MAQLPQHRAAPACRTLSLETANTNPTVRQKSINIFRKIFDVRTCFICILLI